MPLSVHVPLPDLSSEVVSVALLSTIVPAISPVADVEPCNVRVLLPVLLAVNKAESRHQARHTNEASTSQGSGGHRQGGVR